MKKCAGIILLSLLCIPAWTQTTGLLEQVETKVRQLLTNAGIVHPTDPGTVERINAGLTLLLQTAPPPSQAADIICQPLVDCGPLIQKAVDAAPDGATLAINAGEFIIGSAVRIQKPLHLKGQGKFKTSLTNTVNIGFGGSGGIIHVGKDTQQALSGVTLSDFQLRSDRAANPSMRTIGVRVKFAASEVTIRDMHFEGNTSSPILLLGWHMNNLRVLNNTANEYYEQFVEASLQHSTGLWIVGNAALTTKGHPSLGATEPFPIALTPGHSGSGSGLIDKVYITGNDFYHKGMLGGEAGNTVCMMLSEDRAAQGYQFGFRDVFIVGNKCREQGRAVRVQRWRTTGMPTTTPPAFLTIEGNDFSNHTYEPISIEAPSTKEDHVFIVRNQIALRGSWNPYKITTAAATIYKAHNRCSNVISSTQVCN